MTFDSQLMYVDIPTTRAAIPDGIPPRLLLSVTVAVIKILVIADIFAAIPGIVVDHARDPLPHQLHKSL